MGVLKTRAVVIDTVKLASEFKSLASATRAAATELARESLQAQLDAIVTASARRAEFARSVNMRTSSGTIDDPLLDAEVVISERRGSNGTTRAIVYVNHRTPGGKNLFSILDKGRKAGRMHNTAIFPAYEGHVFPEKPSGDPNVIGSQISSSNVVMIERRVVLKAGSHVAGTAPLHLYQAAAEWVEKELFRTGIISKSGRSKLRLNQGDVVVFASDRARFNQ